jgi:predicted amidohydrolase
MTGPAPPAIRVLAAQLAPEPGDPAANAARLAEAVAAHPEADLAVFPESYLSGYERHPGAETALDGEAVAAVRAAAATHATAIVVGITEPLPGGEAANAALVVDAGGGVVGVHRKTQLFGDREQAWYAPGDHMTVVPLGGWRMGVQICFEIEFPELSRALARAGADALVTISANPAAYAGDHDLATRARALDNRLPHVYANRVGREGELEFGGGTRVVAAGGEVLAEAPPGEGVLQHVLEPAAVDPAVDYVRLLREPRGVHVADTTIPTEERA